MTHVPRLSLVGGALYRALDQHGQVVDVLVRVGGVRRVDRIDPTVDPAPKSLRQAKTRRELAQWLAPLTGIDAEIARDVLADIDRLTPVIDELEHRITRLVADRAPALLALPGSGARTAAI